MFRRLAYPLVLVLFGVLLGATLEPFSPHSGYAQAGCQTFKETGKTVCGRFLEYWQKNGGLAQQGLPLSGEFAEVSPLNGKTYTVQYFERAAFEKHPENAVPYDVLLSQLGTFQFKAKYPNGEPSGAQPTQVPVTEPALNFKGNNSVKTAPFALSGGTYEISWVVTLNSPNQGLLGAQLKGVDNNFLDFSLNVLVKPEDTKSGSSFIYKVPKGQFYLDITALSLSYDITLTKK